MSAAQPYVLEEIGIPEDEQGSATGDITFYSELLIIALVAPWGVVSDKIGRRFVYFVGLFLMAVAFIIYPFAPNFGALVGFRLIYAVGAAACAAMLTAVLSDVIGERDRGRASGIMGVSSGLGAVFAATCLLQIPSWSENLGTTSAFKVMYGATAGIVIVGAIIVTILMHSRSSIKVDNEGTNPLTLLKQGFTAAYHDPRLALGYCAGFVARGDAVVLTTFLSLWIQDWETSNGETPEDAASSAGVITGVAQTFAVIFALVAGYISTKYDNVRALCAMSVLALIGYGGMSFMTDPTSMPAIVLACVVGVGEIGVIVSSQALVSRRSPKDIRGSIGGAFGLCGSVGILVCSKLGGALYDSWNPAAPFVIFACFNGVLLIGCFIVIILEHKRGGPPAPLADEMTYDKITDNGDGDDQ